MTGQVNMFVLLNVATNKMIFVPSDHDTSFL